MDPVTLSALIGAGASLGGGFMSFFGGQSSAKEQMDFQERMFQHRYRYTMADMKKAGLNPILAGEVGGGSTPMGATNPAAGALGAGLAGAGEAVIPLAQKKLDYQVAEANKANLVKQGTLLDLQSEKARHDIWTAMADSSSAEYKALQERIAWQNAQATQSDAQRQVGASADATAAAAALDKANAALSAAARPAAELDAQVSSSEAGKAAAYVKRVGDAMQSVAPKVPIRLETGGKTINLPKRGR